MLAVACTILAKRCGLVSASSLLTVAGKRHGDKATESQLALFCLHAKNVIWGDKSVISLKKYKCYCRAMSR
jgi:hypothetical protein